MNGPTNTLALALSLTLSSGSFGCATTNTTPEVANASVPVTPVAAPTPVRTITLTLTPVATQFALACQREEPAAPNGIDDDCDGRVDGKPTQSADLLSVSLVRSSELDVALALRASDGHTIAAATTRTSGACESAAPFALTRIDYTELAPGSYELVLTRGTACESKREPFAHVSLWTANEQQLAVGVSVGTEPVVIATALVR